MGFEIVRFFITKSVPTFIHRQPNRQSSHWPALHLSRLCNQQPCSVIRSRRQRVKQTLVLVLLLAVVKLVSYAQYLTRPMSSKLKICLPISVMTSGEKSRNLAKNYTKHRRRSKKTSMTKRCNKLEMFWTSRSS